MKITEMSVKELKPYAKNTKKHDKTQIANVAESIKQYGFVQPIVVDKDNNIVIGHCRYEAAKKLKLETVPCVCVDELTDEQVKALRIVDNKSNESPWDMDFLADELAEVDLSAFDFDFGLGENENEENPYTQKIEIPHYEITGEKPSFEEMYDREKENELISEIENSDVSEKEKEFLIEAAHRHCCFNYRNIAEYYAHASAEMQKLMEKSALVIIDYENAIANGYVELSEKIKEIRSA
jgi:hypothetical protein